MQKRETPTASARAPFISQKSPAVDTATPHPQLIWFNPIEKCWCFFGPSPSTTKLVIFHPIYFYVVQASLGPQTHLASLTTGGMLLATPRARPGAARLAPRHDARRVLQWGAQRAPSLRLGWCVGESSKMRCWTLVNGIIHPFTSVIYIYYRILFHIYIYVFLRLCSIFKTNHVMKIC